MKGLHVDAMTGNWETWGAHLKEDFAVADAKVNNNNEIYALSRYNVIKLHNTETSTVHTISGEYLFKFYYHSHY